MPLHDAPMFNESSDDREFQPPSNCDEDNSIDESSVDEYETDDEEFLIALKNRKAFKDTPIAHGASVDAYDDMLGNSQPEHTHNVNGELANATRELVPHAKH
ncbi:hypothetical protein GH714_009980 [Hevea brasiliensis]|uniref:Uncharacterized protein n=1 Tax=Hevea brasiliensis TaxID=3981 RepID=A0A6A6NGC0_HEVBR|nr:hypothetical protein GH714_009980 [Hevea brasiliensis]